MDTLDRDVDVNSLEYIAAPTDRRPDFVAQALSPAFRIGLLLEVLTVNVALFAAICVFATSSGGVFAFGDFFAVMYIGILFALTFFSFLVFGAFLGNNPAVSTGERYVWYALFITAGPLALPVYWWIHVWPAEFQPLHAQTT